MPPFFEVFMDKVMIYHPLGTDVIWGITCKFQTFERKEAEELLARKGKEKWYKTPLDFPKAKNAD